MVEQQQQLVWVQVQERLQALVSKPNLGSNLPQQQDVLFLFPLESGLQVEERHYP